MTLRRVLPIIAVAGTLFAGCKARKLTNDQLVGYWQMDSSAKVDATAGTAVPKFFLNGDGSFTASSLPPDFAPGIETERLPITGGGSWQIAVVDGGNRVRLTFKRVAGDHTYSLPYGAELFPDKSGEQVRLYYYEGDPDDERRNYFTRH
jgi:hypothetical protein